MNQIKRIVMACMLVMSAMAYPVMALADGDLPKVMGEVKKVKPKSGKITIRHEPIPNLDMPGMSMVFRVEEGLDISEFKKGDSVEFTVVEKDGKMLILSIDKTE